ncbi:MULTISPECIES: PAAR domain-containing protein [unclassified Gilliamella]|uniref:PAAR domain-containing protein n=1 Tax=unclassified Gilliamella TaxID=2685620 RepID=UPI00080E2877|nr:MULTISPECIES: PAAR domain-containing protein [Gilliamella]MCX8641272.1 PAAR domain-containing protein [Gilliamella sp. B3835]MCX8706969.1 PAAR domain-containing protein [Gilliamella sp. B3783]MCX8709800.1 PAAR domain-containing protein [Gilliamella sp. B3780]MCX8714145.1 PAAR domain-containing protein [Gilliamella sp. B3781]MCX8715952.1 PAAR domain-containing protein [Gilliamella sp. B3784]
MGENIVRLGDPTTHGGSVISASSTMTIEGKPAALIGDLVSCPKKDHGVNKIIEGAKTVFSDGKAVVINQCSCECGCKVLSTINTAEME